MSTYTIYLGTNPVATVKGTEYAYEVYDKTKDLAELLGRETSLVWDATVEEVAYFDPNCDWLED